MEAVLLEPAHEAGFLRAPRSRRCMWLLQGFLAVASVLHIFGLTQIGPQCGLKTLLNVFGSCGGLFGGVYLLSRAFFHLVVLYAQYPKRDGAAAILLTERMCAVCAWLWLCLGCVTYVGAAHEPPCWPARSIAVHWSFALVLLASVITIPFMVVFFDFKYRRHLADSARVRQHRGTLELSMQSCNDTSSSPTRHDGFLALPDDPCPPPGFQWGKGSMAGNNCWISSMLQLLRGTPSQGRVHDAECSDVRLLGVAAGVWARSPEFITACPESVNMVCSAIGHNPVPNVVIFAGRRGDLRQDIPSSPDAPTVWMFNPRGLHFDPLWPTGSASTAEHEPCMDSSVLLAEESCS